MSDTSLLRSNAAIEPKTARLVETAVAAIAELSGRISVSSVRQAWGRRASWSGYARAMQLQGTEIDEIDVFCWGSGVAVPGRRRRPTMIDEFESFQPWNSDLASIDRAGWKDRLPFTPVLDGDYPRLLQALDLQRQYALRSGRIEAWLGLPIFIQRLGLSITPLPCLVAGSKAYRLRSPLPPETVRASLNELAASARREIDRLDQIEVAYRAALNAIRLEYRPGRLPELLALSLHVALLTPAGVAIELGLTQAGAGKLLERAEVLGLVVEISGRRSWKTYVTPDLAIGLGFRKSPVGRPRKEALPLPYSADLADTLASFDKTLAEIDAQLARLTMTREAVPPSGQRSANEGADR